MAAHSQALFLAVEENRAKRSCLTNVQAVRRLVFVYIIKKPKNHSWKLEGACKLRLAVRFLFFFSFPPQVGQHGTLSPCKEPPNYSVCLAL